MAEILLSRYEQFVDNKSVTHITTNLSATEIEKVYGNRLRSRMRSMFNLITFSPNSSDKR
jgi:DNA replication protein DnaC